jgi:hypothetical protein
MEIHSMKKILLFALFSLCISSVAIAEAYKRTYEFTPLHISKNEFLNSVNEIFAYIKNTNKNSENIEGEISLGRGDYTTEIALPLTEDDYEKFPRVSYESHVFIRAKDGLVNDVQLWFTDNSRKIKVTGSSHDHVTGLLRIAEEKFSFYETVYGGTKFRWALAIVAFLLFMGCMFPNWFNLKNRDWGILYVVSLVLINALFYLPPWETVFPGFIVGVENSTFLEKHAALFTFLGFLLALVIPAIGFVSKFRKKNST